MSIRNEFLTAKLKSYLDRRTPPQGIANNLEAQKNELAALMSTLSRYAPRDGLQEWWAKFETVLGENARTRAWPTENEIATAGKEVRGPREPSSSEPYVFDGVEVNASRMNAGEAVGDSWLFGRQAVALERSGLVTKATMRQYRSGLYFRLKEVYGEQEAKRMEADLIARHEAAEALDGPSRQRTVAIPDKRVEAAE